MKKIGVRELKTQLTNVVRTVREQQVEYTVTVHGNPVAVLRPFTEVDAQKSQQTAREDELRVLDEFANTVGTAWSSSQSGVEILEELREQSAWR